MDRLLYSGVFAGTAQKRVDDPFDVLFRTLPLVTSFTWPSPPFPYELRSLWARGFVVTVG